MRCSVKMQRGQLLHHKAAFGCRGSANLHLVCIASPHLLVPCPRPPTCPTSPAAAAAPHRRAGCRARRRRSTASWRSLPRSSARTTRAHSRTVRHRAAPAGHAASASRRASACGATVGRTQHPATHGTGLHICCSHSPGGRVPLLPAADGAYLLAFAIIMLNTDAHNPMADRRGRSLALTWGWRRGSAPARSSPQQ